MSEDNVVAKIIEDVKKSGDKAVRAYTKKFDRINLKKFEISKSTMKKAFFKISFENLYYLKVAARSIKAFAERQKKSLSEFTFRSKYGKIKQRITPIEKVGCYIPSGRFPLVSTALMTIIPAKVAGVDKIIVCTPRPTTELLMAADIAGANRIFQVGGAQAIAAMAYGTKSIPKVDMIVGPGNKWVAEAKKLVFGDVGTDLLAGPSELVAVADSSANPQTVAAELIAQSEHGPDSTAILITESESLEQKITAIMKDKNAQNCKFIKVKEIYDAAKIANELAPEHIYLETKYSDLLIDRLKHFGTAVVGPHGSVVFSDYGIGPNHTLPTGKSARFSSGLSVFNFMRVQTIQTSGKRSAKNYAPIAETLASIEGLINHRDTSRLRTGL